MQFLRTHKVALYIGLLAFALRFILVFGYAAWQGPEAFRAAFAPGSDSARYLNLGHNLAYEGVYSPSPSAPYEPEQTIEPVYPVFLAVVFSLKESLLLVALAQIFLAGIYYFLKGAISMVPPERNVFWGGIFLGVSALTRPEVQFFPIVFVLAYLWM